MGCGMVTGTRSRRGRRLMASPQLIDRINARGTARAIVIFHPHMLVPQDRPVPLADIPMDTPWAGFRGTESRSPLPITRSLLMEISDKFHTGTVSREDPSGPRQHQAMRYFPHLGIAYGTLNRQGLMELDQHEAVEHVTHEPEALDLIRPVARSAMIRNPTADMGWGLIKLGIAQLWEQGYRGDNILIAHLDTGVDTSHPALTTSVGQQMVFDDSGKAVAVTGLYTDSGEHGTHTAGVIAGRQVPGCPVFGVAPDARLASGTVIEGGNTVLRVLSGLNWAISSGARILSLSVGVPGPDSAFEKVMHRVRARGMLPIIAIGNSGRGNSYSPGDYENVISVGATDEQDQVANFSSSRQPGGKPVVPVVCAPGVNILSAAPGGSYTRSNGTSEAAPHIAGLAALLMDAAPTATNEQILQAILASCTNPANVGPDRIGAGIPHGPTALGHLP